MTAVEVLIEARGLVRKGWTTGAFARTKTGRAVPVDDPDAIEFCGLGALVRAAGGIEGEPFSEAYECFRSPVGDALPQWNDKCSRAEVLAHYDETIATMRSRVPV